MHRRRTGLIASLGLLAAGTLAWHGGCVPMQARERATGAVARVKRTQVSPASAVDQTTQTASSAATTPDATAADQLQATPDPAVRHLAIDPAVLGAVARQHLTYLPGRVLVKFRDGVTADRKATIVRTVQGARITATAPRSGVDIVSIPQDMAPAAAATTFKTQADVEYAEADHVRHVAFTPNDPDYSKQWNFPAIGMDTAWDINNGGTTSFIVAVLDTGVAFEDENFQFGRNDGQGHILTIDVPFKAAPDLTRANRWVTPHDFIYDDDNPVDLDGHGTHVSGTIGQLTNNSTGLAGMAFNVRIMPVKICATAWDVIFGDNEVTDDLDLSICPDSLMAEGIRYAADNGAKVINLSIGGDEPTEATVQAALNYAVGKGVFVAIAAGNEFEDGNPVVYPAALANNIDGVMSVAAVGRTLQRAFYSSSGSYVEIAAPGGDTRASGLSGAIYQQTLDDTFFQTKLLRPRFDLFIEAPFQGTSMATPHVAALAALLMTQGITNPAAVEAAIKQSARDLGSAGRDNDFGFGLIQPTAALRGLGIAR
jgi:serine protease